MPRAASRPDRALELRDVSKYFGESAALKKLRFRVEPGESVLVYGPNGAGKTTLLRTLATLSRPTEGNLFFSERDVGEDPSAAKAAIGFVSHATFLYGDLTGRENLRFTGRLFGLSDLEKKIDAVLELFVIGERADEPVRDLSRGLQQRMTLARAFLHEPDFLLLDEPFTGLDAVSAESLRALLARLPELGKALVFSTHDFAQGASIARRLVAMEKGFVRFDGPLVAAPLNQLRIAPKGAQA
ncbi:MAG TPA: ABC transporter ATP-binding protein [Terriglobia bacterium]|nr:ABC transporter ATP-binding protein [Terriglobia bacterium]